MENNPSPEAEEQRQALLENGGTQEEKVDKELEDKAYNKISTRLIPLLFLTSVACYVDRSNLSLAALDLKSDLGISEGAYGLAAAIFFVPYLVLQIPCNWMIERIGAPIVIGILLIGWGCSASLTSLIQNKMQLYLLRFALGVFESGTYPGMLYYLNLFYPQNRLSFPVAIVVAGTAAGVSLSAPIAAGLFLLDGKFGWRGWRWLLFVEGLPAIILGICALIFLPREPINARFLKEDEKALVMKQVHETGQSTTKPIREVIWSILRNGRLWILIIFWMFGSMAITFGIYWGPTVVQTMVMGSPFKLLGDSENDEKEVRTALLVAIPNAFGAMAMMFIGWSSSKAQEQKFHAGISSLVGGLSFLLLHVLGKSSTALGLVVLSFASMGTTSPAGPLTALQMAYMKEEERAFGVAWANAFVNLTSFFTAMCLGRVNDAAGTYIPATYFAGGVLIVAGLGYILFVKGSEAKSDRKTS